MFAIKMAGIIVGLGESFRGSSIVADFTFLLFLFLWILQLVTQRLISQSTSVVHGRIFHGNVPISKIHAKLNPR